MPPRSVARLGPDAPYELAVWVLGSRRDAAELVASVVRRHDDHEQQLAAVARDLLSRRSGGHERDRLQRLDDILRSDPTVPVTLAHPLVSHDVRRLLVLQWELKRTCLMAVVAALPPMPRVVFVAHAILALDFDRIAALCVTTVDAAKVAWTRGSRQIEDYLSARCQHVHADNFCRCETRLGVALEHGFVRYPDHADELPDTPIAGATHRDGAALYASLPRVRGRAA